jgi:hypothetical protein
MKGVFGSGVTYSVVKLEAVIVLVLSCEGGSEVAYRDRYDS